MDVSAALAQAKNLVMTGRLAEAEQVFRAVAGTHPDNVESLVGLGVVLQMTGRNGDALGVYKRALEQAPENPALLSNYGVLLKQLGRHVEAISVFERLIKVTPEADNAWYNFGNLLAAMDQREEAQLAYHRAMKLAPANADYPREGLFNALFLCDFEARQHCSKALSALLRQTPPALKSYGTAANIIYTNIFEPLEEADRFTAMLALDAMLAPWKTRIMPNPPPPSPKIKLGYISPDFGNHPVGHVTRSLFANHDRGRFEIFAYSLHDRSTNAGSYNADIKAGCDKFTEIGHLNDDAAAAVIRADGIHVLVDLVGVMNNGRLGLMARRAAPVQVFWLGHAGGVCAATHDYLIADRVVCPPGEEGRHLEQVVRLPECYHVADRHPIPDNRFTRADFGLDEDAVVFCAFNNPQKIDPRGFGLWMAVLGRVAHSQLWLTAPEDTQRHLRAEAERYGIDPQRLVFAPRVEDKGEHLARHQLADLFLDTMTLNASTTALDALWAGLPIVTRRGGHWAGRICASMLTALAMDELIAETDEDFVDRAARLAVRPKRLAEIRRRLHEARLVEPLYDTARFTRHLEAAFERMVERHVAGEPPAAFDLAPLPKSQRLMMGSGPVQPGWRTADVLELAKLPSGSVEAITAPYLLHRLDPREELPQVLAQMARVLQPGAPLVATVPDMEALCRLFLAENRSAAERAAVMHHLFGAERTSPGPAKGGLTLELLADLLGKAGFTRLRRLPEGSSADARLGTPVTLAIEALK